MATETPRPTITPIERGYPPAWIPTIFADGVANVAPIVSVIRFYLYRTEPEQAGEQVYKNQVAAQVVMPLLSSVTTALFFEKALKGLVEQGLVDGEKIEEGRKLLSGTARRPP